MNEDILTLHYYGDGLSDAEREQIEIALENDESLRERYAALCRSLDALNELADEPAQPQMVTRWHRSIDRAAASEGATKTPAARAWHFPSFAWGALAATVVLCIAVAWYLEGDAPRTPFPRMADDADIPAVNDAFSGSPPMPYAMPASFSRGLQVYLRQSRRDLMQLAVEQSSDRSALVMDIMRQNRLFERAARENRAHDVARVLRAFEPVLMRLATEDLSAQDAAALKSKLTFELNVVLTKMSRSESDDTQSI